MKKFILEVTLFLLPVITLATLSELLLRQIPNDYKYKCDYLDNNSKQIETLILGNSHSFYGINPEYFSNKAFNAGYISQSLDNDYKIYNKYIGRFDNLKTIIIPVSYFSMWDKLETGLEHWRSKNYVIYYDLKTGSCFDHFEILSIGYRLNFRRLISYYILKEPHITSSESGWGNVYKAEKSRELEKTGERAIVRHTKDIYSEKNKAIFDENLSYLNRIIELNKNVYVILFTPPAYKTYYDKLEHHQMELTLKTASEIAEKHNNCIYLNLLKDTTFIKKDFYDADHLNNIGAKKLSILLNEIINKADFK